MAEEPFYLKERTIWKSSADVTDDEGNVTGFTIAFPICQINEYLNEPENVLAVLNKGWKCKCKEQK